MLAITKERFMVSVLTNTATTMTAVITDAATEPAIAPMLPPIAEAAEVAAEDAAEEAAEDVAEDVAEEAEDDEDEDDASPFPLLEEFFAELPEDPSEYFLLLSSYVSPTLTFSRTPEVEFSFIERISSLAKDCLPSFDTVVSTPS